MTRESFNDACEAVAIKCAEDFWGKDVRGRVIVPIIQENYKPMFSALWEVVEALQELRSVDELDLGDESILEQDQPNHPIIKASVALALLTQLTTQSTKE